jgi:hypothetical protein
MRLVFLFARHPPSGILQKTNQLESCRLLAEKLTGCCEDLHYSEFRGGHDPICWAENFQMRSNVSCRFAERWRGKRGPVLARYDGHRIVRFYCALFKIPLRHTVVNVALISLDPWNWDSCERHVKLAMSHSDYYFG